MKILELFSGTASFSKVAMEGGHQVFTVDNNHIFDPSLCIDIMQLTPEMILEKFGQPDIIWASKIIDEVPFKCPVHQCGGIMETVIRKKPEYIDADIEGYNGDEQTPDLICSNCKAVYQFKRFR